jgi:hypothetical protein
VEGGGGGGTFVTWQSLSQAGARGGGGEMTEWLGCKLSPRCTKKHHFLGSKNPQALHTLVIPALMKFQNAKKFPCMHHLLLQSFTKVDHLHVMIENFTSKYSKSQNASNS